jgi:hypothetical protein
MAWIGILPTWIDMNNALFSSATGDSDSREGAFRKRFGSFEAQGKGFEEQKLAK